MGRTALSQHTSEAATALPLHEWRARIVGLLRAPGAKLAGVIHAFASDGMTYRLRAFCHSVESRADEELFEAMRCYNIDSMSSSRCEETIQKGLYASVELQRRYSLDPDLATEKYYLWLDATGREDPTIPPAIREAWHRITKRIREEEKRTFH